MKHQGKSIIRLGDATDHGGSVVSASGMTVLGKKVALEGDMTHCPKCKGDFAILPSGMGQKHHGKWSAYQGTGTACGASLIGSV